MKQQRSGDADFAALMQREGVTPLGEAPRRPHVDQPPEFEGKEPVSGGVLREDSPRCESDLASWHASGMDASMRTAQRRNRPERSCDLHGMTIEQSWRKIDSFLANARSEGLSVVQIVHGKGTGVLRRKVRGWLQATPEVVWFCEARGNPGAVLLRVRRERP